MEKRFPTQTQSLKPNQKRYIRKQQHNETKGINLNKSRKKIYKTKNQQQHRRDRWRHGGSSRPGGWVSGNGGRRWCQRRWLRGQMDGKLARGRQIELQRNENDAKNTKFLFIFNMFFKYYILKPKFYLFSICNS